MIGANTTLRQVDPWLDNEVCVNADAPRLTVTDPATGADVSSVALSGTADVDRAVHSSALAQPDWAAHAPVDRGRILAAIARALLDRADEFVAAERAETGKLEGEMRDSLTVAADYFEYYGGVVRAFFGDTIDLGAHTHAYGRREPFGVVGMITPWNGPLTQAARGLAAALAVGNAVVIKPSEFTSTTTVLLAELAATCGLPPGVLNVVTGTGPEVGGALVAHPGVRMIAFTGSVAAGRVVARTAGERLVPISLELGGKSPNIVFADADLDRAAASANAICASAGQQCAALSRMLVQAEVYDEFVDRVGRQLAELVPGRRVAALTTPAQYAKVLEYFRIAEQDGARLVTGGRAATEGGLAAGRYVHPTLYADVTPSMRVFREEIFGPVLAATSFRTEAEAIGLANATDFGLVSSVWTGDSARALRVAAALHSGQVIVNGAATGIEVPFGGYKASGHGREKGFEALRTYSQLKTTVVAVPPES